MKYYISFILFSLFTLAFASCNTDDLERDIDALKDRVTNVETQVQQLNDEMNIIRVLLDGNKTITNYSIQGNTYTLTLSNGETLTLTPGTIGGNYPSIEIGDNGNWVIGGEDTGWRAEAKDGDDASITPQFKIEANPADGNKKYWYVSYDNGTSWAILENGLAEGTNNNNSNPISAVTVNGDNLEVTFNGEKYLIPIVKGLECAINAPEGVSDGLWMVAGGGESSFTVKVNLAEGDLVRVNAPTGWKAKLSQYAAGETEVTVTVTPPSTPSESVIVVEVTHGVNTATDQIKAKTTSDSYWAEYQAGFDIKIGDVVINKYDYPNARLLQDAETVPAKGVYFIADGATVKRSGTITDLILIAEKKDYRFSSKISTTGNIFLGNLSEEEVGFLCKGISLSSEGTSNVYWFNISNNIVERLYFEHCKIELMLNKNLSNFSNVESGIKNLLIESCYIEVPAPDETGLTILFVRYDAGKFGNVKIHNNVFYCNTSNRAVSFAPLLTTAKAVLMENINISIENNTLINILPNHGTTSGFLKIPYKKGWTVKNNLIWYDTDCLPSGGNATQKVQASFLSELASGESLEVSDIANNKVFTAVEQTKLAWGLFRLVPTGFTGNAIMVETISPFVDGTLSDIEGKYTLKPEYQGLGATIE